MVSQLFLGVRLDCAKCHHHPFEVWGQDDFYSFAAFFGRIGRKGTGISAPISGGEEVIYLARGPSAGGDAEAMAAVKHPHHRRGDDADAAARQAARHRARARIRARCSPTG